MHDLLDGLNPAQREAVITTEGPVLLLAGAGSGKTRVLTHRIAHLVADLGVDPSAILAVTFTNKAAGEMRERVRRLLGPDAGLIWVSTFHSSCVRILRNNIEVTGRDPNFVIYDDKEQLDILKRVIVRLDLDPERYTPRAMSSVIDKLKNEGLTPGAAAKRAANDLDEEALAVYRLYQEELLRNNAMDFGDLLLETLLLFRKAPEVLEHYQQRLRYILVDEYQDTNHVQYLLVKALSARHSNLCVVGDDDQSIYSWRGADIRNILEFNRDYPDAAVIKLEQNYRSTKNILAAAQRVVEKNRKRTDKTLWTDNADGDMLELYTAEDDREEVAWVLRQIKRERDGGLALSKMAIMYRMNSLSRGFEEALLRAKVAYQMVGGMKFYDRKEIKDVLSLLRFMFNQRDMASLRRVIENFAQGIGKTTLEKIDDYARQHPQDLLSAAKEALDRRIIAGAAGPRLRKFVDMLEEARMEMGNYGIREFSAHLLRATGYVEALERENTEEARSRIENLGELLSSMGEFEEHNPDAPLAAYLDQVALVADVDQMRDEDMLTLMTLHSAKGLEYPVVFLVGMEEKVFPHSRSQGDPEQMEEERRLCYVGITRAEKRLYLSHAKRRRLWGDYEMFYPSQFLADIPPELLNHVQPPKPAWLNKPAETRGVDYEYDPEFSQPRSAPQPPRAAHPIIRRSQADTGKFKQGCKVSHPSFGIGLVVYAEGDADNPKLTVKFETGVKKIMARFVPLEIVENG
jgi:DNA helicase II / ATP-dependent DNA helicase PcrA